MSKKTEYLLVTSVGSFHCERLSDLAERVAETVISEGTRVLGWFIGQRPMTEHEIGEVCHEAARYLVSNGKKGEAVACLT